MKIAHLCLSCFFIDGHSYQENEIVRQHVLDGHEVIVLASTETYTSDGLVTYTNSGEYVGSEGAKIKRLAYRGFLPNFVMAKLRINVGVYDSLTAFQPDVILFHGTCGWELLTAARYVSKNRRVLLYVDSHEDRNNSARGFISREILHRRYYGAIIRRALPHIRKILCISTESIDFVHDLYKIPMSHLEFFPLGGRPIPDVEYRNRRDTTRNRYGLTDRNKLLIQSGKQTRAKKLIESLRAIRKCPDQEIRFFIVGVLHNDIQLEAQTIISEDSRIRYLGWKTTEELTDLLCAADVYLQPGTQSVTMQHSLCAHCAIIVDDVKAHHSYFNSNGWLIGATRSLRDILTEMLTADLLTMQENSFQIARERLDYAILAQRVLS